MTKFEIKTDRFEFRFGTSKDSIPAMTADEVFEEYLQGSCNDPELQASFDSLEAAQEEFKAHYAGYGRTYAEKGYIFWLLVGEVSWIEEAEYDEDGEFLEMNGTWAVSAEGYKNEEEEDQ